MFGRGLGGGDWGCGVRAMSGSNRVDVLFCGSGKEGTS